MLLWAPTTALSSPKGVWKGRIIQSLTSIATLLKNLYGGPLLSTVSRPGDISIGTKQSSWLDAAVHPRLLIIVLICPLLQFLILTPQCKI